MRSVQLCQFYPVQCVIPSFPCNVYVHILHMSDYLMGFQSLCTWPLTSYAKIKTPNHTKKECCGWCSRVTHEEGGDVSWIRWFYVPKEQYDYEHAVGRWSGLISATWGSLTYTRCIIHGHCFISPPTAARVWYPPSGLAMRRYYNMSGECDVQTWAALSGTFRRASVEQGSAV